MICGRSPGSSGCEKSLRLRGLRVHLPWSPPLSGRHRCARGVWRHLQAGVQRGPACAEGRSQRQRKPIPMTTEPVIHITFGIHADNVLRTALRLAGRRERVVRLWDDLSLGPSIRLNRPSAGAGRSMSWAYLTSPANVRGEEQCLGGGAVPLLPGRPEIAWVSRRMPHEFCGFLEWLSRLGNTALRDRRPP